MRQSAYEFQLGRRLHALLRRTGQGGRTEGDLARQTLEDAVRTGARPKRPLGTDIQLRVRLNRAAEPTDAPPRTDLDSYRTNLRTIAGAVQGHGVHLVFVTQQTTWNSTTDPEARAWQWMTTVSRRTYRVELMDEAMEAYNDVLRKVARERSALLPRPAQADAEVPRALLRRCSLEG